ncbi:Crp/Fnr family transcriptional regulator [Streptomyces sp. 8P21H-1]|nr:Crp/Fnr family transcriptional regulator [Streptomyces sp. 8P21H-1]
MRQASREELLKQGIEKNYSPHQTLLQQGDSSRHVLLLTRGVVKVTASSESGNTVLLAVRIAGDLVGEMAAFEDLPRSGTVVACNEVSARIVQLHAFEAFLTRNPDAMKAVLRMLSARLRWANRRRIDYRSYSAPIRFARVLAELGRTYAQPVPDEVGKRWVLDVTLTQRELASLAGLALPTAEKSLSALTAMGLVQRSYRNITICDVPKLLEFAKLADENPY